MALRHTTLYNFHFEDGHYKAEIEITPGEPEHGPTYDCGGTPAEPAEIDVMKVWSIEGNGELIPVEDFETIAEFLHEEKYDDILIDYHDNDEADKADAAEARLEQAEFRADCAEDR